MRIKIHPGYGLAAVGYMIGIFLTSSAPEEPGPSVSASSAFWDLLHIPLFAGLASCLLLSLTGGRWFRRIPVWAYSLIVLVAVGYAAFDEWHQTAIPGRYGSLNDFLLNCVGIAGLLLIHRLAGGARASS